MSALARQYMLQAQRAAELQAAIYREALEAGAEIVMDEIIYPEGYVPKTLEQHKKELGWE